MKTILFLISLLCLCLPVRAQYFIVPTTAFTRAWLRSTDAYAASASLNIVIPTNGINTGIIPVGQVTVTNLTGNITLGGFSGVPTTTWWTAILLCTNSTGVNRTVTYPAGVTATDGTRSCTVTNQQVKIVSFGGLGNFTNAAAAPSY